MRGTEGRDLARPRLVIANVGAEAGKVRHHRQLHRGQRAEHQQRGGKAGVGIVDHGAEVVEERVGDQRDQNRAGDESRQFAAGRLRSRRGRDREYRQCGGAPPRKWRPRNPPPRPVPRDLQRSIILLLPTSRAAKDSGYWGRDEQPRAQACPASPAGALASRLATALAGSL